MPALMLVIGACAGGLADSATTSPASTRSDPEAPASIASETSTDVPERLLRISEIWATDFQTRSIDLEELIVGISTTDPRDVIQPIHDPVFEPAEAGADWLDDREPGALVEVDGLARFYPLSIMTRHEIVNDELGGKPVVVTYCPLCNTAVAFDPVVAGERLRFGVSGLLRQSDLVMWDDQTESLWQQITGEAIVGAKTGTRLKTVPSAIVSWGDFRERFVDGEVLAFDQGFGIEYGANPYVRYSSLTAPIRGFFEGGVDDRYPALSRVVGVSLAGEDKAYPFEPLSVARVVNDTVGGTPIVVLWGAPETADALNTEIIANGRAVGTGVAYLATVDGQALTFEHVDGDLFTDVETGTTWTLLGDAVAGSLEGSRLEYAPHRNEFWFAFQAFFAGAEVWQG